ncbi:hypothetical protein AWB62_24810 (plasmid) [Escherichia coli]|jgi:hypothetical protein|nr:hypothetical protein AWB62_24810 [Escherichia coli]VTQ24993.1 Uncharacterised protein [Streptococcus pneumoniae]
MNELKKRLQQLSSRERRLLTGGGDYLLSVSVITHFGTLGNYGRKNGGISLPVKKTLWNG